MAGVAWEGGQELKQANFIHTSPLQARASVMARAVKSKRIADLATVGRLELSVPGGLNAKGEGEIVIRRIASKTTDEINEGCLGSRQTRPFVG